MKESIKKILNHFGLEVRRRQPQREEFFTSRGIDTVIDAGANVGQFGNELRRRGFKGTIVSFEPVQASFSELVLTSNRDARWITYNCGLSNKSRKATITVSHNSVFSSLHATKDAALNFDPGASISRGEEVQLRTLSDFAERIDGTNLFLKVDTQGHEREVVEGAGRLLDRVQGIQLELPISALYEGSWTIGEALDFMRGIGFVPTLFLPVNFHRADPLAIVEVDCIFRRHDAAID